MIDYEVNVENANKEREDFVAIVSEIEDGLFEILINYISGKYDLNQARRKVLNKAFLLHHYMKEHFTNKEYNSIKNNSFRSYSLMSYHVEHKKARNTISAIQQEIEQREEEDGVGMRKNTEHIDVPSIPGDFITDEKTQTYSNRMDALLLEMAALVKEGHEIQWSENKRWCKINGKVFNVHKNIWLLRKDEVL